MDTAIPPTKALDWSDDQLSAAAEVVGIFIEMDLEERREVPSNESQKKEGHDEHRKK